MPDFPCWEGEQMSKHKLDGLDALGGIKTKAGVIRKHFGDDESMAKILAAKERGVKYPEIAEHLSSVCGETIDPRTLGDMVLDWQRGRS